VWTKSQQDSPDPNRSDPEPSSSHRPNPGSGTRQAVLGPSISIKGDLAGEEDLLIEGQVEGQISFRNNTVTIGASGRVQADVYCKVIHVDGQVKGNLHGEEKVVIRKSGVVEGNAVAPRVILEDGSRFRGSIEMRGKEEPAQTGRSGREARTSKPQRDPASTHVRRQAPATPAEQQA